MHIVCSKSLLAAAVARVNGAVAIKSTIPALEGVLIETKDNSLFIAGYDLAIGITTEIEAIIKEPGSVILPAKRLNEMIIKLSGEAVDITVNEKLLCTVLCDNTEYTMLGMNAVDFPELPDAYIEKSIVLSQKLMKRILGQTVFAISSSEVRPVHTGAKFDFTGKTLTTAAIDGARLAISKQKLECENEASFVVPKKTLVEIQKMLDESGDITIGIAKKHIIFELNSYKIISRLLEGDFIDYNAPVNGVLNNYKTEVNLNRRKLTECLDRANVIITEKIVSPIRLTFENNNIGIECSTSVGRIKDDMDAKITGEDVRIGFNNQFILDALRNSDDDEIKMYLSGSRSPMLILPHDGDEYIFMIMPMRI